MNKHAWAIALAIFLVASFTPAGQSENTNADSWSGVIINGACTVDEAFAEAPKCATYAPGAALALYDDTIRQVYALDTQEALAPYFEESVTVRGRLDGNTIHAVSIKRFADVGLRTGEKAPEFSAPDQFGKTQTLESLRGPKGVVLLFYRSADWCPYCKGQLIQLQAAKARFEKQGLRLAGISYDSVQILKYFTDRRKITFPLLSDPDSKIIQMYGVLNSEAMGPNAGMARPGYFFIDPQGVIHEKFFEAKYRERLTGNSVLAKLFPELGEEVTEAVKDPHLEVRLGQSDRVAVPGNLVTLTADVRMPADLHVYAPGAGQKGYMPVHLVFDSLPDFVARPPNYPAPTILYLPAIKESVQVYEGAFRLQQVLKINSTAEFSGALGADGKQVIVKGSLQYQACNSTICFQPTSIPLQWELQIIPLDRQRAPEDIRHK
ncbi:MAG TPA: peroxiredoxin family protein [Candidatus Acidoferrales bacterium]|jgi:peroxiredoxin